MCVTNLRTMKKARYFVDKEFNRCSTSCSIEDMDQEFLDTLDKIREEAGIPLVINSAYRSPEYERSKGRSGTGAHTHGVAVDVRCKNGVNRLTIIEAAVKCGIKRMGIADTYIHIDQGERFGLPENVWTYYK